MANSDLIAEAQTILNNLNSNLETSYNTTGTFIMGRLVFTHIDKYHHQNMHPTPSVDRLEVTNASEETLTIVAELNAKIAELHDAHIDVTGKVIHGHQHPDANPALRSEELYQLELEFTDETENIEANALTKAPIDAGQHPDHIKAVLDGQAIYDTKLATGEAWIPDEHYRPGKAPPPK